MQGNKKRGGARKNSGPKLRFGELSVRFWVSAPKSKAEEIKELIKEIIKKYE